MNRITSTITYGNTVPYDERDDWQRKAHPYTVELRYQGRKYTFPYWTGPGWDRDPTTCDAAGSILMDASSYENARGFEDWAADLGYDTDSRTAERVYRAVERAHANVKRLLGPDFREFLYLGEDGLEPRCR